jgi:hypothetical protein
MSGVKSSPATLMKTRPLKRAYAEANSLADRPHAGQDHRGVQQGIHRTEPRDPVVTSDPKAQGKKDQESGNPGKSRDPPGKLPGGQ